MREVALPSGVDELSDWLDRSGGRHGRIAGVRRARWEDWAVVHRLATMASSPFYGSDALIRRRGDGCFDFRRSDAAASLQTVMLFFEARHTPISVADAAFAAAETAYVRARGQRRWFAADLSAADADLDPDECRQAVEDDLRVTGLGWYEFCVFFIDETPPLIIDSGEARPAGLRH